MNKDKKIGRGLIGGGMGRAWRGVVFGRGIWDQREICGKALCKESFQFFRLHNDTGPDVLPLFDFAHVLARHEIIDVENRCETEGRYFNRGAALDDEAVDGDDLLKQFASSRRHSKDDCRYQERVILIGDPLFAVSMLIQEMIDWDERLYDLLDLMRHEPAGDLLQQMLNVRGDQSRVDSASFG